jgi:predicted  nucleic acid-binding Zn-ribbon protein
MKEFRCVKCGNIMQEDGCVACGGKQGREVGMTKEEFAAIFISEGITNERVIDCFWKVRDRLKTLNEENVRIGINMLIKKMLPPEEWK